MSYLERKSTKTTEVMFRARDKLEKCLVGHLRFSEALGLIRNRIDFPLDSNLLFIVGPSGVGKSRLMVATQKMVLQMHADELNEDRSRLPYVAFDVQATNVGNFAWGPFYVDYLEQLQLPLAPSKEILKELPPTPRNHGPHKAVMSAIAHRRPLVTLLDEANHLCQVSNARLLPQQLDKIKSIANRSRTLHVMFGTYELAALLDASPQLARRSNTFHFSRYRCERQCDLNAFTEMIKGFGSCVPLHHTLDLKSRVEFMYEKSIGCTGIVKNWLMAALGHACRNNRDFITFQDLEATAMQNQKLRLLLSEAKEKESILDNCSSQNDSLREMLNFPYIEQPELPLKESKNRNASPGTPNPRSDPTGGAFRDGEPEACAS